MAIPASYQIVLPQFEGPFDLLLFFIERDELNIQDIPIHKITKDFLQYIHQLEELNIEVAGEFILVAATLMRIKAKMLLPRKELDEQGNEIDPRQELVQKLLEYKRYKEVIDVLQKLESERASYFKRGGVEGENKLILQNADLEADLESVSLFRLLKCFHRVMDRYKDRSEQVKHQVVAYSYTIEGEKIRLINRIREIRKGTFENLFLTCQNRMHAIFMFLALLELVQQQLLTLEVGEGYNQIYVSP